MEVSWGIGLKDKTEELVQKRLKERKGGLTPFEQYMEKRKEKRKQKKEVKKKNIQQVTTVVCVGKLYFQVLFCLWVRYSPSCNSHCFTHLLSENCVLCFFFFFLWARWH
jgi:hypothetical protein